MQSRGVESLKALFNVSIGDFAKENPLLLIQLPLQELRSKYSTKRLVSALKWVPLITGLDWTVKTSQIA